MSTAITTPDTRAEQQAWDAPAPACECMLCDLPEGVAHEPVSWRIVIGFPGPYPKAGEVPMFLCEHCAADWLHGEWEPPLDNFLILSVTAV